MPEQEQQPSRQSRPEPPPSLRELENAQGQGLSLDPSQQAGLQDVQQPPVQQPPVQQEMPQQAEQQSASQESKREPAQQARPPYLQEDRQSFFGPNARWLWFAGGVMFILVGVLFAILFNLGKPVEQRNDAIKWAAIGMAVGFVINIITITMLGGVEFLFDSGSLSSGSSGSLF